MSKLQVLFSRHHLPITHLNMKVLAAFIVFTLSVFSASAQCGDIGLSGFQSNLVKLTPAQAIQLVSKPLRAADSCNVKVLPVGSCSLLIFNKNEVPVGQYEANGMFSAEQRNKIAATIRPGVKLLFDKIMVDGKYVVPITILIR